VAGRGSRTASRVVRSVGRVPTTEEKLARQGGEVGFSSRRCGTGEAAEAGFFGGVPGGEQTVVGGELRQSLRHRGE
jgi:hypothetical protein